VRGGKAGTKTFRSKVGTVSTKRKLEQKAGTPNTAEIWKGEGRPEVTAA